MEDSGLFMPWAMDTLQHEHLAVAPVDGDDCGEATFPSLQALREASQAAEMVQELIGELQYAANGSWSSGSGDGDTTAGNISGPALSRSSSSSTTNQLAACWNFTTASATQGLDGTPDEATARGGGLPLPELAVCASPPTRRAVVNQGLGSMYAQDHIIAERKRREKINQRFIELSTVIPGLKKMDKATILSDATRYVKELQEKLKALQDSSHDDVRSIESCVLVKKPCIWVTDGDSSPSRTSPGTPPAAKIPLPEIEARFLEKSVMVRIHCEDGKGVAVRVLTELEALHLSFIHTNVMTFSAGTLIITITAKVVEGFTVTADEIVGRLNSALLLRRRGNNSPEETGN